MKTKLTLLLLFFCLLPALAEVKEEDKYWIEFIDNITIAESTGSNVDIVYTLNEEKQTYTIYTAKGLAWVAKVTNDGSTNKIKDGEAQYYPAAAGFKDCTIELGDIANGKLDISGHKWVPIGNYAKPFEGIFNGKNQEITGLSIEEKDVTDNIACGLFGITIRATIVNLGIQIKTFSIDGGSNSNNQSIYVGGIAGLVENSEISNCYVYGDTNATIEVKNIAYCYIGGLVGVGNNYDRYLTNSYSMINIIAESNKGNGIGGIVGILSGMISNTFATGSIVINSPGQESWIGGICGLSEYATLNNNLALNKGGITVKDNSGVKVHVARISSLSQVLLSNNYATPNFIITGQDHIDSSDADGITIGSETDLAAILNGGSSGDNNWSFPKGGGLPCLNAFEGKSQPAASVDKEEYEIGELDLATFKTDKSIIYLKYIKENGWYVSDNKDTETAPFNGKISGTSITKEIYIIGENNNEPIPTLNVVENLGINNSSSKGMYIEGSVNLNIIEGKKLDISGLWGLETNGNITLNQLPSQSRDTDEGGITIIGTNEFGIWNEGILNINVDKLTVKGKDNDGYGIANVGTLNCKTGLIEIKGDFGIGNNPNNNFNIQGAEVTINQGDENAISNYGTFNIASNGTLNIKTKGVNNPIYNNPSSSTFTIESGATFITWPSTATKPAPYALTYSTPSEGTLLVRDQNGITLQSGVNIGAGNRVLVSASHATKDVQSVTYKSGNDAAVDITNTFDGSFYSFEMPAAATEVSVAFKEKEKPDPDPEPTPTPDPDPAPTIYYTVTLPAVEGATLDPGAGDYDVESWSTFRFYLTLAPEYDQSQPIVTTDRGETIAPRQSDGAYLVKYVRTDVAITIDGIVKNPDPVANDAVDADNITIRRTADGLLIHVPSPETLTLYTFAGTLVRTIHLPAGDTRIDVPTGTYIVRVGTKVEKVII